ncbi:ABC transporter substrate-binding protein, partial [uncultured Sulfitobacter sp.]|uniref:ABC transporter substrate-binding protein n=1 Tax=uncultured Sulfitobacter sp. TaxID=191468 RepID=UPI002596D7A3
AYLRGEAPFEVKFLVSDRSGKDLFFDMVIEGISMRLSERTEIGAMLDQRRGDIDALIADLTERVARYQTAMEAMEVRKSAAELRAIWAAGNEYLQAQAPWTTFKTDPDKAAAQVRLALNLIPLYAVLSAPFIPTAAASMLDSMKVENAAWPDDVPAALAQLAPGHAFEVPEVLFAKITDDQRDAWAEKFAGVRS